MALTAEAGVDPLILHMKVRLDFDYFYSEGSQKASGLLVNIQKGQTLIWPLIASSNRVSTAWSQAGDGTGVKGQAHVEQKEAYDTIYESELGLEQAWPH